MPRVFVRAHGAKFRGIATVTGLVGFLLPLPLSGGHLSTRVTHTHKFSEPVVQSEATALSSAKWMSNVSVTVGNGAWTFRSSGLPPTDFVAPDYAVPNNPGDVSPAGARIMAAASILQDQNYDYTLPLTPAYTSQTTPTNLGPIGVALDGAVFFNPYEANDTTVATADNFVTKAGGLRASFLDNCDGHPGPHGQYHYHGLPACLADYATGQSVRAVGSVTSTAGSKTEGVSLATASAREPVLLGFAFDGYGIYDNIAMNGKAIPVSELDACNGISSPVPGYSNGVYHYVLENIKSARADIGCYHGVVSSAYTQALKAVLGEQGGPPADAPISTSSSTPQTAYTLAANRSDDSLLHAVVAASDDNVCG
ncbi:MAG TPA: YHYH protein [Acidimicrobiales bacterium]|nr:YHYH protein [Acidimicrobiales bacterium]